MKADKFPNGFSNWQETHFEVVSYISEIMRGLMKDGVVADRYEAQGIGGMYELAEELTDEFENQHKGYSWDGDWLDTLENFLDSKLKN